MSNDNDLKKLGELALAKADVDHGLCSARTGLERMVAICETVLAGEGYSDLESWKQIKQGAEKCLEDLKP